MRIVHTSDWHLGHQLHGVSREREHATFLEWLVEVCAREAADVVLITGDVFDGSNPPATAQAAYYRFLADVAARRPGVQVVVIGGNHDSAARLEAPAPLLSRLRVSVVGALPRVGDAIDWERAVFHLGGACVLAVPFLRIGDLAAAGAGDDPTAAIRALYAAGVEVARARADGAPLIVLGHLHVSGAEASALSERRIVLGGAEAVTGDLFPADAAYVALGHLHKPQRIGGREQMRYAGSPIPLAMNEAEYRHQVLVVDIGTTVRVRPIEVPRTVELIRVPRRGAAPLEEILPVLAAMEPHHGDHDLRPYLEVHVRLDRPLPDIRGRVEQALEGKRARLVKITVERAGDGAALGDATPGIALADLAPRDVLVRRWRRDHEGDPPAALIAAFDALVARVQESP